MNNNFDEENYVFEFDMESVENINYESNDINYLVERLLEGIAYNLGINACKGDAPRRWRCGTYAANALKPYRRKLKIEFNEQELKILLCRYYNGGRTISETIEMFPDLKLSRDDVKVLDRRLENILTNNKK